MSIDSEEDLEGIKRVSEAVAFTLKQMREHAKPGMTTKELDDFGYQILQSCKAQSAPKVTYDFPGYTCISINNEAAHGIPSDKTVLKDGDLVNIDVSAELNGYYADNGGSFILGEDIHGLGKLVDTSRTALHKALKEIKGGKKIAEIGRIIETEAKKNGFKVIKNLVGHGVGRSLHEEPHEIPCFYDKYETRRFRKNTVVAVETFISTKGSYVHEKGDGWTLLADSGAYVAQHEHTILITDGEPIILTAANGI
ncbi:type I methionyl aminopeptidase [Pontibacter sp. HSC-14F20]|uniref:type I methionyl aminopeptidase n=1 Tax=Pontibacter sp. HSC-14F20 TaxID=2864136 RepID=UPI001C7339BC|nr:type I methionyl aminopeptidase [Pontibacter sp. HSC-14F20]MBX0334486.1 type I methionyl aminopeptidase [Pontibacter sp. HSC-14F20]